MRELISMFADIPITSSDFWQNEHECTEEALKHVFRSATEEEVPLLRERLTCLREAGQILYEVRLWSSFSLFQLAHGKLQKYQCSFTRCIEAANHSAAALVNILADNFPCFNDVVHYENRKNIRFLKRAQICVADLWAAFDGEEYGDFDDIGKITMFADYRVPQILNTLGCLWYSPPLENTIRRKKLIESGHTWEIQVRGLYIRLRSNDRGLILHRLQHMVCRVNSENNLERSPGSQSQCYIDRFLPL